MLLLLAACLTPSAESLDIVVDTAYRGVPELEEVAAECGEKDALVVHARTKGWSSSGLVQVWDQQGGYAYFFTHTTAFLEDETCDVVVGSTADAPDPSAANATKTRPLVACTSENLKDYTILVQVWYERGCAGVLAWGPESRRVEDGTIDPSPLQVVESGLVDNDCTELLQPKSDDQSNRADITSPPLTCPNAQ